MASARVLHDTWHLNFQVWIEFGSKALFFLNYIQMTWNNIHVTSRSWLLRALSKAVARQLWWAYTLWGTGRARRGALTAAQWPSILPEVSGYHKGGMTWRKPLSLTLRGFKLQRTYFTGSIFHLIAFYELTLTEDNSSNFCVSHPNTELVMLSEFNASLGNKKIGLTIG